MVERYNESVVGGDAILIESIILGVLSLIVFEFSTGWEYEVVFQIALGVVFLTMCLRAMAGTAEDPNMGLLRKSLRLSSKLLQLALIGGLAGISLHASAQTGYLSPITFFVSLAFVLSLSFVVLDLLVLREYAKTWSSIIHEETDDNVIGLVLRKAADFGRDQIEAAMDNGATIPPNSDRKTLLFGTGTLVLLLFVSLPVWLVLTWFFDGVLIAMLVVLSLLLLRDLTRYIYINYGAAQSLSELRWSLECEFAWTIAAGILLASVLGYELPSVL